MVSGFDILSHDLIDAWVRASIPIKSAEHLYRGILGRVSIKMSISLVETAADDPYDWYFKRIRNYGFKSKLMDWKRLFPDSRLRDLDRTYIDDAIIPIYSRVLVSKRPLIDQVKTKIAGISLGYDRLILPQKSDGKPEWCISLTEGRFMVAEPNDHGTMDLTDEGIVQLLVEGHTAKEIAEALSLSPRTVEHRIDRMKERHGAKNLVHLVAKMLSTHVDRRAASGG